MGDIGFFLLIQVFIILLILGIWIVRNTFIKNKKLQEIVEKQNKYLEQMYETISMTERKIKEIDKAQIFQSDDEIGFFFTSIKGLQEQLSEYIKFMK